jgi:hypothetical protein
MEQGATEVIFSFTPPKDDDSIFGQTPVLTDDLFGDPSERPTVQIPLEAFMPQASVEAGGQLPPLMTDVAASLQPTPTDVVAANAPAEFIADLAFSAAVPAIAEQPNEAAPLSPGPLPTEEAGAPPESLWPVADVPPPTSEVSPEPSLLPPTPAVRPSAKGGELFVPILLIFLIPYAIFITGVAAYFYYQLRSVPDPLELLPDFPGDNPGGTRRGQGATVYERITPDRPLPRKLHVALGQAIDIGDLRVIPEKIEERKLLYCVERGGVQPEPSVHEALVLTLRLRNISKDVSFHPIDAAFNTRWNEGEPRSNRPYMFVEIGARKFYGGPFRWQPRASSGLHREPDPREYIQGQEKDAEVLKPGEERKAIVCTNPENRAVLQALHRHQGPIVWRVQLRRGLVDRGEREIAVSAVIGVDFQPTDVQLGEPVSPTSSKSG